MAERILIVEDEETLCASLKRVFLRDGYEVETADNAELALEILDKDIYDIVITDIILPGINGIELLKRIKEKFPEHVVIIITAYASLETAVEALRAGAYDYVVKPIIHEEIKQIVKNALRQKSLHVENILLKKQIKRHYDFSKIIGESNIMQQIINEVKKISDARSNVLLLGETGTGKELIARAIHFNSNRADKPFLPINCSAIPENLLESELFGHVKGAFTGAITSKKGLFEEANGGTIFLDEIGDLSPSLQSKLLRAIEDHEIRPVGGTQGIKVNIRFISATNKNIEDAVKYGSFREDLFYRINVITIKLPPLRERREDIDLLAKYFLQKYSSELGKPINGIDKEALEMLKTYHWPGNIRELQNIIERAILIAENGIIKAEHLPDGIKAKDPFTLSAINDKLSIEDYTKKFIQRYQNEFNEQQLADMLGITRKSLWEKRKKWGITRE
ncbi:sigma-54-dependent Fis family transcriptional regulator [hot springs metagenome]|uniref:Sigma-54-dependent Fis family transcriptional regulator n=1 Tax=hot springs metagenome TaxID=433727 RepID=A0A5J4L5A2_9ZZZZ